MQRQKLGFSMSTVRNTQGKQSVRRHRMAHTPDCAGTRGPEAIDALAGEMAHTPITRGREEDLAALERVQ